MLLLKSNGGGSREGENANGDHERRPAVGKSPQGADAFWPRCVFGRMANGIQNLSGSALDASGEVAATGRKIRPRSLTLKVSFDGWGAGFGTKAIVKTSKRASGFSLRAFPRSVRIDDVA